MEYDDFVKRQMVFYFNNIIFQICWIFFTGECKFFDVYVLLTF